jgi:hypothetical protein
MIASPVSSVRRARPLVAFGEQARPKSGTRAAGSAGAVQAITCVYLRSAF